MTILHFCPRADWAAARDGGEYRGDTLATEGFIHCSPADLVHLPANLLARGRTDLVLLEIDPERVAAPIRWEPGDPTEPASPTFPHLYGPLPVTAVVAVHEFQPDAGGDFQPLGWGGKDVLVRWASPDDPAAYVRNVLALEAGEISRSLYEAGAWSVGEVALADLGIDRGLLAEHDSDEVHVRRRDNFVRMIRGGASISPLIALGADLQLVDGYARYRALQVLGVPSGLVCRQER